MTRALSYEESAPPPALRHVVRCVWRLSGDAPGTGGQPIVPDGCPEIVINLADPFLHHGPDGPRTQPAAMIVGQTTGPTVVRPSGRCEILGIRLQPWGGFGFLGSPMADLTDAFLPAAELVGPWATEMLERLVGSPGRERAAIAFAALRTRIGRRPQASSSLAPAVVGIIARSGGRVTIRGMARTIGASERTIQRVLRHDVGLPPKTLARILRLQGALGALLADPGAPMGRVALAAGYYDQAHFTKEFRRLVGLSPSEYLGRERDLTEPFVSGATSS